MSSAAVADRSGGDKDAPVAIRRGVYGLDNATEARGRGVGARGDNHAEATFIGGGPRKLHRIIVSLTAEAPARRGRAWLALFEIEVGRLKGLRQCEWRDRKSDRDDQGRNAGARAHVFLPREAAQI
jgi:hypothetical protein